MNLVNMDYSIVAYDGRAKRDRSIVDEGIIKAQMVNSLVCVGPREKR